MKEYHKLVSHHKNDPRKIEGGNNMKRILGILLALLMLLLTAVPAMAAEHSALYVYRELPLAEEELSTESTPVELLGDGSVYVVHVGDEWHVQVQTEYDEGVEIAYYWNAGEIHTFPVGEREAVITIPEADVGSVNQLQVQAVINDYTHEVFEVVDRFVYQVVIFPSECPENCTCNVS